MMEALFVEKHFELNPLRDKEAGRMHLSSLRTSEDGASRMPLQ